MVSNSPKNSPKIPILIIWNILRFSKTIDVPSFRLSAAFLVKCNFINSQVLSYVEYWDGDPTNSSSTLIGLGIDASTSYRYIWATDTNGSNDGFHSIFARAYDKAGNYRDSTGIEIQVDTYKEPKSSPFPSFGTILILLTIVTIYIRKREKK
ncbi:MAG: hypothetical protein ACXAC6_02100 [Candidatus Hodarchaeales archaeon]|jgi:hypothetical protein